MGLIIRCWMSGFRNTVNILLLKDSDIVIYGIILVRDSSTERKHSFLTMFPAYKYQDALQEVYFI